MEPQEKDLSGSYALHALTDHEREVLLRRASESAELQAELDQAQLTASQLAELAEPVTPPAQLKNTIMSRIRNTEQSIADSPVLRRSPGSWGITGQHAQEEATPYESSLPQRMSARPKRRANVAPRVFALAATTSLVIAGGLGVLAWNQHNDQQELQQQLNVLTARQDELNKLLSASDMLTTSTQAKDGGEITLSYSADRGLMAVATSQMPSLPDGSVYELWLISPQGAQSAGLLGADQVNGMRLVEGNMEGVTHFGITVEPVGGSPAPTTTPIMLQEL